MVSTVVPSKLAIPVPRTGTFDRPELVQILEAVDEPAVRAVIAPAGWGKSQLLTRWLAVHDGPVAYVSLDALDNDPSHCWTHLLAAVGTATSVAMDDLIDQLRAPVLPLVTEIVEPLLARVDGRVFTLVLDDFHVIRSAEVYESVEALLDKRTVAMGACIASRTEPSLHLPRRRVRNELVEIRVEDLRMNGDEAARLLDDVTNETVDRALVSKLVDRTEGWAAGLYLAGLSMRGTDDSGGFVEDFAGNDRNLSEYLASEVLASLNEEDRGFLLGVAVLEDLDPEICNSMLGSEDAADRLDRFSANNLFLVPTDRARQRFRFHHLFREWLVLLLDRTDQTAVVDAHRRAYRAYASRRDGVRAMNHALAAEDWPAAHRLLMRYGLAQIDAGNHQTVSRWCSAFPSNLGPALRFDVAALRGWTAIVDGDLDAVDRFCTVAEEASAHLSADDRPVMSPGDIPLQRGYRQLLSGSLEAIGDTIAVASEAGISARTEATLRWLRAAGDYWLGDADVQEFVGSIDFAADQGDPYAVALSNGYLAHVYLDRLEPVEAERWTDAAFAVIDEHRLTNFGYAALPHLARARIALSRGDLSTADGQCARAIDLAGRRNDVMVETLARIVRVEVQHARDNRAAARAELKTLAADVSLIASPGILAERLRVVKRQLRLGPQPRTEKTSTPPVEELTDREMALMRLLPGSLSQRELGEALHLSFNTVKTYNRQIYRKLGVSSRDDAVMVARRLGLL